MLWAAERAVDEPKQGGEGGAVQQRQGKRERGGGDSLEGGNNYK